MSHVTRCARGVARLRTLGLLVLAACAGDSTTPCATDADCPAEAWCEEGACVPQATCSDGIQNQDEDGVDCGGPYCPACPECETTDDCPAGSSCENGACVPQATCSDGIQNQDEDGVDCGGPHCPACPPAHPACTHYASDPGGGDGQSPASPLRVAEFWSVAQPGDVLCLLDGTYRGDESMIHPPTGLSGTEQSPITIAAYNDGKVLLTGEGERGPVQLDENDWLVLQGFDACCARTAIGSADNSVFYLVDSSHVVIRRAVGWDSADGNTAIFVTHYSTHNLYEDVAGFGTARKIIGAGHRSDTSFDSEDAHNVIRRAFARLQYNTWGGQVGLTAGYNTNGNIVENCIVTMDGHFENQAGIGSNDNTGIHDDRHWDERNEVLGSIVYRTEDESISGTDTLTLLNAQSTFMGVRDVLVVVEEPEASYGVLLHATARLNPHRVEGFDARQLTFVGGPGTWVVPADDSVIRNLIVMNATWNTAWATPDSVPATGLFTPIASYPPVDYVMAHGNTTNWNVAPLHSSEEDPDLLGRCGNLLQYGCSEAQRPTVAGEPVGAQIQCRFEDGVLTNKPLWPWPMEERIRVATCMVDEGLTAAECEASPALGVHVTRTVFELGGGQVPDFTSVNPIVCPGS